ncbi:LysR family transcriptional regulator [Xylophilus sp. Kf1]|nr:LysR family transcriptional regulator [Xylophilus sp. Kf1]
MDGFSDLAFFGLLNQKGSMAATAQELGVTGPAISKRLAQLEGRLGVRLLNRTTRRMSLTAEGETYLVDGARLLHELEALERTVSGHQAQPKGLLRVSATLGFGRRHIAPALGRFAERYPGLEVQLHLSDRPVNLVEQAFDVVIRFGEMPDAQLTARLLAANRRILCASPAYLRRAGAPATPRELARHACIFIREGDETFGTWHLRHGAKTETVKVRGPLSTNDGESATGWALAGHGILMRSQWEVAAQVAAGALVPVLPDWHLPAADVYAVFRTGRHLSPKTRVLVDHLLGWFAARREVGGETWREDGGG